MIESTGFLGRIYAVMEWITRIAYINILWILFSALGLFILGIAPASIAIFTIIRKWLKGNTDINIMNTFWHTYRTEFIKSNLLLWPLILIGYILYIDFQYIAFFHGPVYLAMLFIFINITIIYIIVLLYIFPIYVHFEYKFLENYKNAFLIGVSKPFITLSIVCSLIIIGLIMERLPGLIPFFAISLASLTIMWFTRRSFLKIDGGM